MKYLNGVLTVIAVCLVLITFAVTGLIPAAHAKGTDQRFVSVPVNADGSVNVKFVQGQRMNVNIEAISDYQFFGREIPINIKQINDKTLDNTSLKVTVIK